MVVKPLGFVEKGRRGFVQPAVKCRGREYLRIIYGPEYTLPEHLDRLRSRGLGRKRSRRANLLLVSSLWSDLSAVSRCAGSMNVFSACWLWKPNLLIHAFDLVGLVGRRRTNYL